MSAVLKISLSLLWRRRTQSILLIVLVALIVAVSFYLSGIAYYEETAIEKMINSTDINCIVTDARGMNSSKLSMSSVLVQSILGVFEDNDNRISEFVKDVHAMGVVFLTYPDGMEMHRIYDFASDKMLSEFEGAKIELFDGFTEDIFKTSEQVCIVSDSVEPEYDMENNPVISIGLERKKTQLRIVGTISNSERNVIYVPLNFQWEKDASELFLVDSCTFTIKDNNRLEEAKNEIYKLFAKPDLLNGYDSKPFAVVVQDDTYLESLDGLRSNLRMVRILIPILTVLTVAIGFFASYLFTKGRIKEFAVQRCLGLKRRRIFFDIIGQQTLLAVIGYIIGLLVAVITKSIHDIYSIPNTLLLLAIFISGASCSAFRIAKVNPIILMKTED